MPLDLETKLGILFAVGGLVAGVLCGPLSGSFAALSLLVLAFLFYLCYRLAPKILKFQASQLPGGWSGKVALKRYFDMFFLLWLVFWVLAHTDLLRL
jgi:hypothetical protein